MRGFEGVAWNEIDLEMNEPTLTDPNRFTESDSVPPLARSNGNERFARVRSYFAWLFSSACLEIVTASLLGLAAVASSWSSYQATRWGGVQSRNYGRATALRLESTRASTRAGQMEAVDLGLFANWLNAAEAKKTHLQRFYRKRFRPEFIPAFEAWLALDPLKRPDAPASPFVMPQYKLDLGAKAMGLESEAAGILQQGQAANEQADLYVLNSVVLAVAMFFAGMAQQFDKRNIRLAMLALAVAMCVYGLYHIATYPIA